MRVHVGVLLAILGGALSVGAPGTSAALGSCHASSGRTCTRLAVPLDRSGKVPGTIRLWIERAGAKHAARPPLFLIAGGPGQSATAAFDSEALDELVGTESRSRDIVVMDLRGTGRSGLLDCRALQRGRTSAISDCAAKLGPRRDFYSSVDMADDIEAVRVQLREPRIALYGVSYGTHVALTYARRYPDQVDRLLLESPVGPQGADAFARPSMRAVPRVLSAYCGRRLCRSFTRDAGEDVRRLARRLERRPMAGLVTDRRGRRHRTQLDGQDLLTLAIESDSNPLFRAEIPGAVRSALRGDPAPLLRTRARARVSGSVPRSARSLSAAARAATLCADTALPWASTTSLGARRASAESFLDGQPSDAFGPFGRRTALESDVIDTCGEWPSSVRSPVALGPLPNVPALLLVGSLDTRTPVENARAVAALLPQAHLIVVGNGGHNVTTWDFSGCADGALRRFLAGGAPGRCGAQSRVMAPLPPPPSKLTDVRRAYGVPGWAGRTTRAVQLTMVDGFLGLYMDFLGELFWNPGKNPFTAHDPWRLGALRGGSYVFGRRGFRLRRASLVSGVRVDGVLRPGAHNAMGGTFRVSGPSAARGRLVLRGGRLRGRLGGRSVRARFRVTRELLAAIGLNFPKTSAARLSRALALLR